jgi:hypothetical protein
MCPVIDVEPSAELSFRQEVIGKYPLIEFMRIK